MVTLFYTKIHSEFFIFLGVALHYTIHQAIKSYLKKDEWDLLIALVILNIPVTKLSKIYNVSIQAIYQKRKRIQQKIKNICS